VATPRKRTWTSPTGEAKTAWVVDYRDSAGKRRNKQFALRRDADAFARKASVEVELGIHTVDRESVTVATAANLWIARAEAEGRERSTIKQYKELRDLHIVPLIGGTKLNRLTMPAVQAFRDALVATRSKAMAGKAVRALSSIISEAQSRGLVAQNVAKGVKVSRPKRERGKIVIPTREELKALINTATEEIRPLVMTAIFTGLRSSELRGLCWSNVNLKAGTITVSQRADQWGDIGAPKSAAGFRTIPIPPMLVSELRMWKLRAPHSRLELVFPGENGGVQWHNNLLRRKFQPLQVEAGVFEPTGKFNKDGKPLVEAKYGFHALRHAAASAWIKQKVDLKRLTT
jgi:integrase